MNRRSTWLVAVCFAVISAGLQWASGAQNVEFAEYTDEAGQVVTGLMIRDYVASGFPGNPIRYAEEYYLHYPKIVFGMWPPLFHVAIGLWTMVSTSRVWIMLLQAAAGTAVATAIFRMIAPRQGALLAVLGGLTFCFATATVEAERMVMPDVLFAALAAVCSLTFCRFLDQGKRSDILAFGFFAGLSLATKGNAVSLAALPPLSMIFLRRWDLIRNPGVWMSAVIAGVLGLPWQLLMAKLQSGTIPYNKLTAAVMARNLLEYPILFEVKTGPILAALALAGILMACADVLRRKADNMSAVQLALALGFYISHCIVTFGPESRYFMQAMPPLIFLAVAFVYRIGKSLHAAHGAPAIALLLAFATALWTFGSGVPQKPSWGMKEAAEFLLSQPDVNGSATLISSMAIGESGLIAEVAIQDKDRPSFWVLRGSKSLSDATWYGLDYKSKFSSVEELMEYLRRIPVKYLVLDSTPRDPMTPHHAQLLQMVASANGEWREIGRFPQRQATNVQKPDIRVFYRAASVEKPTGVTIDLTRTLGRSLKLK
jgi:hypothetical protein